MLFATDTLLDVIVPGESATKGTCNVVTDGAGTATLTVDAISVTTLTSSGAVSGTTGTFSSTLTAQSGFTVSDGLVKLTPTSQTVTNGEEITVADGVLILTGSGMPNDNTNILTIANGNIGDLVRIVVASDSTNLVGLADTGNLKLTAAFNGDNNDNITLYFAETNVLVELSRADN